MFITGHVLQGLCTSLMLIAAVPPLALGFGTSRLRETAVIMNLCIFGAVALGPTIGGIQASANAWRPLFWIIAAISLAALVLSLLTFEDAPPADPQAPRRTRSRSASHRVRMRGRVLRRLGAAHPPLPLAMDLRAADHWAGIDRRARRLPVPEQAAAPLTIRSMLTSTVPVAGIVVALAAALPHR